MLPPLDTADCEVMDTTRYKVGPVVQLISRARGPHRMNVVLLTIRLAFLVISSDSLHGGAIESRHTIVGLKTGTMRMTSVSTDSE